MQAISAEVRDAALRKGTARRGWAPRREEGDRVPSSDVTFGAALHPPCEVGTHTRRVVSGNDVHRVWQLESAVGVPASQVALLVPDIQDDVPALRGDLLAGLGLENREGGLVVVLGCKVQSTPSAVPCRLEVVNGCLPKRGRPPGDKEDGDVESSRFVVELEGGRDRLRGVRGEVPVPDLGVVAKVVGAHHLPVADGCFIDVEHDSRFLHRVMGLEVGRGLLIHGGDVAHVLTAVMVAYALALEHAQIYLRGSV